MKSLFKNIFIVVVLLMGSISCSKSVDLNNEPDIPATWLISYFYDQQDLTADYSTFYFMFNKDGSVMAHQGPQMTIGAWQESGAVFKINFPSNEWLIKLNQDWQIVEKTNSIIKLKASGRQLHFVKS